MVESFFRTNLGYEKFLPNMTDTTFSRKLDSTGRIMIPIKLREQMGLVPGQEYYFSTMEYEGHKYICIDCGSLQADIDQAIAVLKHNGIDVSSLED